MTAMPPTRSTATLHGAASVPGRIGAAPRAAWGPALAVLAVTLALMLGLLFQEEVRAAVSVWNASTAYNHCWLVLPVALWLAWSRRHRLHGLAPAPTLLALLPALAAGAAWFAAERLGIMEGRQLALIGLLWSLFLGLLGWRVCRVMAGPLIYLVFLVPFGAFLTPLLQDITAWFVDVLLKLTSIPHYIDHLIIEIPEGTFLVAEACAGLRFLIASIAFGALYAMEMFRSPGRRLVVMLLSVAVPIIANGFRAFGIVLLGHILGSAEAGAADHVVYGWLFFSVVILLLILIGLPFRQDLAEETVIPPPPEAGRAPRPALVVLAGGLLLAVAAAGPAAAMGLQGGSLGAPPQPAVVPLALAPPEGCVAEGHGLRCGSGDQARVVLARMLTFAPRVSWGAVGASRNRLFGTVGEEDAAFALDSPAGVAWRGSLRQDAAAPRAIAAAVWLGGAPSAGGLRARVEQAERSLRGGGAAPVMLVVEVLRPSPSAEPGSRTEGEMLRTILSRQGAVLAEKASAAR